MTSSRWVSYTTHGHNFTLILQLAPFGLIFSILALDDIKIIYYLWLNYIKALGNYIKQLGNYIKTLGNYIKTLGSLPN